MIKKPIGRRSTIKGIAGAGVAADVWKTGAANPPTRMKIVSREKKTERCECRMLPSFCLWMTRL